MPHVIIAPKSCWARVKFLPYTPQDYERQFRTIFAGVFYFSDFFKHFIREMNVVKIQVPGTLVRNYETKTRLDFLTEK